MCWDYNVPLLKCKDNAFCFSPVPCVKEHGFSRIAFSSSFILLVFLVLENFGSPPIVFPPRSKFF